MKRGTTDHPKLFDLSETLKIEKWAAIGILESLWHWTAKYAPSGAIGKYSNTAIARGIDWQSDSNKLMDALIKTGWVDSCAHNRLIIHDWCAHADDAVHIRLYRSVEYFHDGSKPKHSRIQESERVSIEQKYSHKPFVRNSVEFVRTESAQEAHAVRPALALPVPFLCPPLPEPVLKTAPSKKASKAPKELAYNVIGIWIDIFKVYRHGLPPCLSEEEKGQLRSMSSMIDEKTYRRMVKQYFIEPPNIAQEKNYPVWPFYQSRNVYRAKVARLVEEESKPIVDYKSHGIFPKSDPIEKLFEQLGVGTSPSE